MITESAIAYAAKIRNRSKRVYAQRCVRALTEGYDLETVPRGDLSYMAAQAVRMQLSELTREDESNAAPRRDT